MTTTASETSSNAAAPVFELDDRFARELPELAEDWQPSPVPAPSLVVGNDHLARDLGLDPSVLWSDPGVEVLAGNQIPAGAHPVALAYTGHQFGNLAPRLGDGRALLLGEVVDPSGNHRDIHLKGSGRTPFARGGDGKATIGPMLREHVIAEALHALGVPTTRSLAVVTTGEDVARTQMEPGAVLTRVAASHIRVGTFEYAIRLGGPELTRRLADHVIARHHPHAAASDEPIRAMLRSVVEAQAELIAQWMLVGFIHGVMNTDNMAISGEGIDYGPCAFMDRVDPATVFSSIDHGGRYAYGNQPGIAQWNLARFAETLIQLLADDSDEAIAIATGELERFPAVFDERWREGMTRKLGFVSDPHGRDADLFEDLIRAMHGDELDLTGTFRLLADWLRGEKELPAEANDVDAWSGRWRAALDHEGRDRRDVAADMDRVNPIYVPRNHLVEEALDAATGGDLDPFEELMSVVTDPYEVKPGCERYAEPAPADFTAGYRTFCGT
ncbi:MAG: YdiU family protein [Acidimicrobiales bacterium]|nr:YdiU family protein [Acidimicrobiales bacterium]